MSTFVSEAQIYTVIRVTTWYYYYPWLLQIELIRPRWKQYIIPHTRAHTDSRTDQRPYGNCYLPPPHHVLLRDTRRNVIFIRADLVQSLVPVMFIFTATDRIGSVTFHNRPAEQEIRVLPKADKHPLVNNAFNYFAYRIKQNERNAFAAVFQND